MITTIIQGAKVASLDDNGKQPKLSNRPRPKKA